MAIGRRQSVISWLPYRLRIPINMKRKPRKIRLLCKILLNTAAVDGHQNGKLSQDLAGTAATVSERSEEHTSELQSLMRTSYASYCLQKRTFTSNNLK